MSDARRETWSATFDDVAPERLWRWISDTDFVNRSAGLPAVSYGDRIAADGTRTVIARARWGPLRTSWVEPPFVWEAPHRIAQQRHFEGGPLRRFSSETRVMPVGAGSTVTQTVELEPRGPLGALIVPAVLAAGRRGGLRAFAAAAARARLDRAPLDRAREPVPPDLPAPDARLAARFVDATNALPARRDARLMRIAERVAGFAQHADAPSVAKMRPYVLADAWDEPRDLVLATMLAATRASLLDLAWTIVCPGCRGQSAEVARLDQLGAGVHCPSCNIDYTENFDRNVEVTFSAKPLGRDVDADVYCALGPHTSRQTYAQVIVPPGASVDAELHLPAGAYVAQRMVDRQLRFVVAGPPAAANDLELTLADDGIAVDRITVAPGPLRLRVRNGGTALATIRITESEFSEQIATAADVTALQDFRDLFSSEVLAAGVELGITSMTILFSDLVGSTRMYVDHGDAPAFRVVRDHFDALRTVVAEHRGAIVKTIGDAVMAAFPDAYDAYRAARRFQPACAAVDHDPALRIRVGLHRGPCIALRANDRLDYFGSTVNLAARVQHAADGGEIVLTWAVALDPRVAVDLGARTAETIEVRGLDEPVAVYRFDAALATPIAD